MRDYLVIHINGQPHRVSGADAWLPLTDFLRLRLRLTGTKVVCAEGDCGSCTISLGRATADRIDYTTVCGCIQRMFQLDGMHVVTVEGLAYDGGLNPVQSAMTQCNGAQCGYCTPGFVVTLHQLLQDGAKDPCHVRRKLTGNLCRCTGYDAILDAARQTDVSTLRPLNQLYPDAALLPALKALAGEEVLLQHEHRTFFKPASIESAVTFRKNNPGALLIAGGTDLGVVMNKRKIDPPLLISTAALPAFDGVAIDGGQLIAGGGATHDAVQRALAAAIPAYADYLEWFGSPQIRQAGTLAGNLATGSPIGDSLPPLCVLNASLELTGPTGARRVNLNEFYTGYRTSVMRDDELITRVFIPIPAADETLKLYKISKRKDLDISTFSAAIWMRYSGGTIDDIRIAFGGVGPTVVRLAKTEAFLRGKPFAAETFDDAQPVVLGEITPISDVRGSADYRNLLGGNILRRLHAELCEGSLA
ncbi:MAG: xanthine dehydrogenase small subunit [Tepidisphaeraceae bacterium]